MLRKRKPVLFDDEAKEVDDDETQEDEEGDDDDDEVEVEKKKEKSVNKANLNKEEKKLLDILKEYSIKKLLQMREEPNFDLVRVQISCPFTLRSNPIPTVFASQDLDYSQSW